MSDRHSCSTIVEHIDIVVLVHPETPLSNKGSTENFENDFLLLYFCSTSRNVRVDYASTQIADNEKQRQTTIDGPCHTQDEL